MINEVNIGNVAVYRECHNDCDTLWVRKPSATYSNPNNIPFRENDNFMEIGRVYNSVLQSLSKGSITKLSFDFLIPGLENLTKDAGQMFLIEEEERAKELAQLMAQDVNEIKRRAYG